MGLADVPGSHLLAGITRFRRAWRARNGISCIPPRVKVPTRQPVTEKSTPQTHARKTSTVFRHRQKKVRDFSIRRWCHEAVGINPREPVIRDEGTKNEEPKRLRDTSSSGKWSEMNSHRDTLGDRNLTPGRRLNPKVGLYIGANRILMQGNIITRTL